MTAWWCQDSLGHQRHFCSWLLGAMIQVKHWNSNNGKRKEVRGTSHVATLFRKCDLTSSARSSIISVCWGCIHTGIWVIQFPPIKGTLMKPDSLQYTAGKVALSRFGPKRHHSHKATQVLPQSIETQKSPKGLLNLGVMDEFMREWTSPRLAQVPVSLPSESTHLGLMSLGILPKYFSVQYVD